MHWTTVLYQHEVESQQKERCAMSYSGTLHYRLSQNAIDMELLFSRS